MVRGALIRKWLVLHFIIFQKMFSMFTFTEMHQFWIREIVLQQKCSFAQKKLEVSNEKNSISILSRLLIIIGQARFQKLGNSNIGNFIYFNPYRQTSGEWLRGFSENFFQKNVLLYCDVTTDDNSQGLRCINRWRVGAPRHDITENLLSYLIKIFEFKADWIEKSG